MGAKVVGGVLDIERNAEFLGLILRAVAQFDEEQERQSQSPVPPM